MNESMIVYKKQKILFFPGKETRLGTWVMGSRSGVSHLRMEKIIQLIQEGDVLEPTKPLGGRSAPVYGSVEGLGRIVIKQYHRGGLMERILKDRYLRGGSPRSRIEYEMLLHASRQGVNVPTPLGFITRGKGMLYSCWLVTREIPKARTLADISLEDEDYASGRMADVARQVGKIIENRILHRDFHPGNVLVDATGRPYIIDFDKASITRMTKAWLFRTYVWRWHRAVVKHNLPRSLSGNFIDQLGRITGRMIR